MNDTIMSRAMDMAREHIQRVRVELDDVNALIAEAEAAGDGAALALLDLLALRARARDSGTEPRYRYLVIAFMPAGTTSRQQLHMALNMEPLGGDSIAPRERGQAPQSALVMTVAGATSMSIKVIDLAEGKTLL